MITLSRVTPLKNFRRRRKENLIKIKFNKCCICGFDAFQEALEFHHVNPDEKNYQLSSGNCKSLKEDLNELHKCALVCSNCHRGIHAGLLALPNNWSDIDTESEKALIESTENHFKKTIYYCSKCGVEIATNSQYCSKCANLVSRVVQRPSREELKSLIRTIPFTQLGKQFSVSDKAISKWCISENLPHRKKDIMAYSDQEWEKI